MNDINILGTIYKVNAKTDEEDRRLEDNEGYCDTTSKKIIIRHLTKEQLSENDNCEKLDIWYNQVLRHEMIHAFLFESGLHHQSNTEWAINEEMIDWMAIQMPKIMKAYESVLNVEKFDVRYIDGRKDTIEVSK